MPKNLIARIRFMENVDVWHGPDAIDRDRFREAFFWASAEFDPGAKLDIQVMVIHCDKESGAFMRIGPYPAAISSPSNPARPMPYEAWVVGKVTDVIMMNVLTNIFANALKMDKKEASILGQTALKHLQSTVSVKELERK